MKNAILYQMKAEIAEWKRTIYFSNDELSKKMDRLVDMLKNTSHVFLIDKIESYQQMIINQNVVFNKWIKCMEEHEFRLNFSEIREADITVIVLQHQSYRNEFEKKQLEAMALGMKFNGFFVDQMNSISDTQEWDINSTFLQVSYR